MSKKKQVADAPQKRCPRSMVMVVVGSCCGVSAIAVCGPGGPKGPHSFLASAAPAHSFSLCVSWVGTVSSHTPPHVALHRRVAHRVTARRSFGIPKIPKIVESSSLRPMPTWYWSPGVTLSLQQGFPQVLCEVSDAALASCLQVKRRFLDMTDSPRNLCPSVSSSVPLFWFWSVPFNSTSPWHHRHVPILPLPLPPNPTALLPHYLVLRGELVGEGTLSRKLQRQMRYTLESG